VSALPAIANAAWTIANVPAYLHFVHALDDPRTAQEALLRDYVRRNANTDFGRRHAFESIDSVVAFQRRVPIHDYAALATDIDRIASGESNVLTADPVTRLATSSGSTRARKLIPYTAVLQRELNLRSHRGSRTCTAPTRRLPAGARTGRSRRSRLNRSRQDDRPGRRRSDSRKTARISAAGESGSSTR